MKNLFSITILGAILSATQLFAGGIHFEKEYSGQFLGDEILLHIEQRGVDYTTKLTYVPRGQSSEGTMTMVNASEWESLFELTLQGSAEKFKIVTIPPCAAISTLTLVMPSGAQVSMAAK